MRNRDLEKWIVAGVAVVSVISVGRSLLNQAESIEKKGLTLAGGIAFIGLSVLLINNLDNAALKLDQLNA